MNTNSSSFSGAAAAGSMPSNAALRIGRLLSGAVVVLLLADGLVQAVAPALLAADMAAVGFPISLAPTLSLVTLGCALLYAVPKTAVAGAVLLTGFLGGAIAMHFRIGEIGSPPQIVSLLLGAAAWAGLYLRDPKVRALIS